MIASQHVSCGYPGVPEHRKGKGGSFFKGFFKYQRNGVARLFKTGGIIKLIEKQERLWGVRGHAPRKNFENLHAVMAILVPFDKILGKFCLHFFTLILSASSNMMHFVRTF